MADLFCPIHQYAQTSPDQIAIESPNHTLTYAQLDAAIAGHCHTLNNLKPHTHVAFIATPTLTTILLLFTLFRLKITACPLSFRTPPEHIPKLLEQCSATTLLDPNTIPMTTSHFSNPTYELDQLATILMTSGSSGRPKAACHTLRNHFTSAQTALDPLRYTPSSRWLLSLPLFHVGGLAILFRTFLAGATLVISDLPPHLAISHHSITHASFVPTQLFRFLQEQLPTSLTCLLLGGAPLSPAFAHKALAHRIPIFTTYGMTEMSSLITLAEPQELSQLLHAGKPLPQRELHITETGELFVRGQTLFQGYWDPLKNQAALPLSDGWFATNDLGAIDENGNLSILGRKDRMFISGGENIQPEEIEVALCQIPGILAAHVIPIDDAEFGKRPTAHILEESPHHTLESVRTALRPLLPSFKHPIQILPYTDIMQQGLKVAKTTPLSQ